MPYFDFKAVVRKAKRNLNSNKKKQNNILIKNLKGYVDITENLDYIIITDEDVTYNIHPDSYKCKNFSTIYSRQLYGKYKTRLIIERVKDSYKNHLPYLPFCVGAVVIGNVVLEGMFTKYFKIKKCYLDYNDARANFITNTFKEMYNDEIEAKILAKI